MDQMEVGTARLLVVAEALVYHRNLHQKLVALVLAALQRMLHVVEVDELGYHEQEEAMEMLYDLL
jgi:hypothetical protein